jgi:hypothetical protein
LTGEQALPEIAWLSADRVVAQALADVRRGAVLSTPSLRYQAASGLLRVLPRAAVRGIAANRATGRPSLDD